MATCLNAIKLVNEKVKYVILGGLLSQHQNQD